MKKFIAAFDSLRFCESTMSYAILLAKKSNAHLVGVFLDDFMRRGYSIAQMTRYEGVDFEQHLQGLDTKDTVLRENNKEVFVQACQSAGLDFSIHRDSDAALRELLHESVYADLLIINSAETVSREEEMAPSAFIRELLSDVQCPVLVTPAKYHPVEKIVLLYDGEPSSVHALRTFSYLFEELGSLDTEVLTVKGDEDSPRLPDKKLIREFVERHFPAANYIVLKGLAETKIAGHLQQQRNPLVVLGAYRRSRFSRMFHPSMADHLMRHLQQPLFIAHNKS